MYEVIHISTNVPPQSVNEFVFLNIEQKLKGHYRTRAEEQTTWTIEAMSQSSVVINAQLIITTTLLLKITRVV